MYHQWAPYVPVAVRRRQAAAEMAKLAKKGRTISPVTIVGRAIATTVWGKAWCDNLEHYSDYSNRLPRGRTYVRNGSVVDLQIIPGKVEARVSGSSIYSTTITIKSMAAATWKTLCADCAGGIESLVELLQGRFSAGVMKRLCRQGDGLFPVPKEIRFDCSCPDGASMCKHVAAVLYGVGARFDHQPELLFILRQVDARDLLAKAGAGLAAAATSSERTLATDDVGSLFGLEMDQGTISKTPVTDAAHTKAKTPSAAGSVAAKRKTSASHIKVDDPASILLRQLHQRGWLDNPTAREITGLDSAPVRVLLQQLVAKGHARVEGQKRGTRYVVNGRSGRKSTASAGRSRSSSARRARASS